VLCPYEHKPGVIKTPDLPVSAFPGEFVVSCLQNGNRYEEKVPSRFVIDNGVLDTHVTLCQDEWCDRFAQCAQCHLTEEFWKTQKTNLSRFAQEGINFDIEKV
jgi:hypothetical protein